jgi:hypothetical protein
MLNAVVSAAQRQAAQYPRAGGAVQLRFTAGHLVSVVIAVEDVLAMRRRIWWMVMALALPCGAASVAAEEMLPGGALDLDPLQAPDTAPSPALDLQPDPLDLPPVQAPSVSADGFGANLSEHRVSADEAGSDRGLSFGFEIRPRSPLGNLARKDEVQDPTFTDQLQKVIERPSFGVRGRYRF